MCVQVLQDLPGKMETTVLCKLTGTQLQLYSAAVDRIKKEWHGRPANTGSCGRGKPTGMHGRVGKGSWW